MTHTLYICINIVQARKQHSCHDTRTPWEWSTHCNTLQHTATHCNTLQHTALPWYLCTCSSELLCVFVCWQHTLPTAHSASTRAAVVAITGALLTRVPATIDAPSPSISSHAQSGEHARAVSIDAMSLHTAFAEQRRFMLQVCALCVAVRGSALQCGVACCSGFAEQRCFCCCVLQFVAVCMCAARGRCRWAPWYAGGVAWYNSLYVPQLYTMCAMLHVACCRDVHYVLLTVTYYVMRHTFTLCMPWRVLCVLRYETHKGPRAMPTIHKQLHSRILCAIQSTHAHT